VVWQAEWRRRRDGAVEPVPQLWERGGTPGTGEGLLRWARLAAVGPVGPVGPVDPVGPKDPAR
jgi:hypothetical protein